MKILLFVKNGMINADHLAYQFDHSRNGSSVLFCNGSVNKGFQDSCDKVVMDCENDLITDWAVSRGITIEKFGGDEIKVPVDAPVVTEDDMAIDALVQSQVAKAEIEVEVEDASVEPVSHEVPAFKDIEAGKYKDPEGNIYERKPQGSKLKGDFTAAIEKFGFDAFEKVE